MGRIVFVVDVPQGTTAYQANDGRYYGRSELEVKHLPDHEIRLRMARGKVARATVAFRLCSIALSTTQEAELRQKHHAALEAFKKNAAEAAQRHPELLDIMAARFAPDTVEFELVLRNDGELTIRNPAVRLSEIRSEFLSHDWTIQGESLPSRLEMLEDIIYPGDEREIMSFDGRCS